MTGESVEKQVFSLGSHLVAFLQGVSDRWPTVQIHFYGTGKACSAFGCGGWCAKHSDHQSEQVRCGHVRRSAGGVFCRQSHVPQGRSLWTLDVVAPQYHCASSSRSDIGYSDDHGALDGTWRYSHVQHMFVASLATMGRARSWVGLAADLCPIHTHLTWSTNVGGSSSILVFERGIWRQSRCFAVCRCFFHDFWIPLAFSQLEIIGEGMKGIAFIRRSWSRAQVGEGDGSPCFPYVYPEDKRPKVGSTLTFKRLPLPLTRPQHVVSFIFSWFHVQISDILRKLYFCSKSWDFDDIGPLAVGLNKTHLQQKNTCR